MTEAQRVKQFNKILFRWQKTHYRDMPWRPAYGDPKPFDPYRILVSEIMLQQTQVDRVREKYAAFMKEFPTVRKLAAAPLSQVLGLWSGLGYNRRAKYLHECARIVVCDHGGKFPSTYEELVALPAIGRSTAGALLAFSFGQDTPMIDTNIRRMLVRVFFKEAIPSDKELYEFAMSIIPKGKGRLWNYAMLDIGAALCTARNHSDACPFIPLHGEVEDFVYKKPQAKFKGSNRFYRGRIMKYLLEYGPSTKAKTMKELGFTAITFETALASLLKEKLVILKRGTLTVAT